MLKSMEEEEGRGRKRVEYGEEERGGGVLDSAVNVSCVLCRVF